MISITEKETKKKISRKVYLIFDVIPFNLA
jgi:hypothetical protein